MQHPKGAERRVLKEVPLGKDLKIFSMLKVGPSVTGSEVVFGVTGGGQAGCLACNKRQVVSLLGAMPLDNSIRQALPVNPERPRETSELITLL